MRLEKVKPVIEHQKLDALHAHDKTVALKGANPIYKKKVD